jgi:hypothetical protein
VPVPRRAVDGYAGIREALAEGIDVIDPVGEVTEVAPAGVLLRVPVVGQLHLGFLVPRGGKEDERETSGFDLFPAKFPEAELIAVKVEGGVEVADAYHGVKVFHVSALLSGWNP